MRDDPFEAAIQFGEILSEHLTLELRLLTEIIRATGRTPDEILRTIAES